MGDSFSLMQALLSRMNHSEWWLLKQRKQRTGGNKNTPSDKYKPRTNAKQNAKQRRLTA